MFLLLLLFIIHILVWLYVVFGGFISKWHALFIIQLLIPAIYILHLLPFHILLKSKAELVYHNLEALWSQLSKKQKEEPTDEGLVKTVSMSLPNIDKEQVIKVAKIMQEKEQSIIFMKQYNKCRMFLERCFQNPLSAQGLLILGFIVNYNLVRFYHK